MLTVGTPRRDSCDCSAPALHLFPVIRSESMFRALLEPPGAAKQWETDSRQVARRASEAPSNPDVGWCGRCNSDTSIRFGLALFDSAVRGLSDERFGILSEDGKDSVCGLRVVRQSVPD